MAFVRRSLRDIPEHLRAESALETKQSVDEMHALARSRIPVDTGVGRREYRKSFNPRTGKGRVGYLSSTAIRRAFYMRFIHDGTVKISGTYFHDRAFDAAQDDYFAGQKRALDRALNR